MANFILRLVVGIIIMVLAAVALVGIIFITTALHPLAGFIGAVVVSYAAGFAVVDED